MKNLESIPKKHEHKHENEDNNCTCNKDCKNCKVEEQFDLEEIKKDINQKITEKKLFLNS